MGNVVSATDATLQTFRSSMFMGGPGTGKTTALLQLYPGKRKLIVDCDDKAIMAIEALPSPVKEQVKATTDIWQMENKRLSGANKIGVVRQERKDKNKNVIPGTEGFVPPDPRGYREITDFLNSLADTAPFPYYCIGIDTLTIVGEHLANMILNHHKVSAFELQLYGVYKQNLLEFVKGVLAFPCHRVICVHETTRENDEAQTVVRPAIMGSYRDEIGKEFSEVYCFNGRSPQGKYTIRTVPNQKYFARTTMGLAPECSVEDMVKMYV